MSYTVLARKYRPQSFADLVGQEHVSRTLGNAIERGRVAHAFLFTGARGVGKTTTARLLAKALNCEKGPTPTPCGVCDPCKEIAAGIDLDVLEIDGASNNGVDDVRRLQETLPFRPARDRFKIVIVDEVHMLSTGAFNAFLKTLEEPPAHVKFIFATTEVHKVPITIRSRCQRYDFRLIPHALVTARVREILSVEQVEADDAAIALVAREAAGSMRDALTVLDQLLALGGDKLEGESVASGLGIASRAQVFTCLASLLEGDPAGCLRSVSAMAEQGLDTLHFARQLLEGARDLVVLRVVGGQDALVELAPDELEHAQKLAQLRERPELERLFAGLAKLVEEIGEADLPQLSLEMGLVRLSDRPALVPLQELLERMQGLEQQLRGSAAGGGGAASGGGSRGGPIKRGPAPESAAPRSSRAAPEECAASAPDGTLRSAPAPSSEPAAAPSPLAELPPPSAAGNGVVATMPAAAPTPAAEPPPSAAGNGVAVANGSAGHAANGVKADPAWARIVGAVKASQPALGAVLDHGMPLEVSPELLRIGFPDGSFFGRQAQSASAREAIGLAAEQVLGARPSLQIGTPGDAKISTLAQTEETARRSRNAARREAALRHPRVLDALEVFEESEGSVDVQVDLE